MTMKQCSKCKRALKFGFFSRDSKSNDNHQRWCKNCMAKYKSNKQHTRKEYNTKYYRTKTYRAKAVKRQTKRRKSGCLKTKARDLLQRAVREGKITKPSICSGCNTEFPRRQIQGHHIDYNLPYFVQWLCLKCHAFV